MPKTEIKINTWTCPHCDYQQDFDVGDPVLMNLHFPGVEIGHCPACYSGQCPDRIKKQTLMVKETVPAKKITMTVMGVEDIETEIAEIKARKLKGGNGNDPDISTPAKENAHRNKRTLDIQAAIVEARKLEDK